MAALQNQSIMILSWTVDVLKRIDVPFYQREYATKQ